MPQLAGASFGIVVDASEPVVAERAMYFAAVIEVTNGVEIAAERAMYWDAGGQDWAGGTSATATRLP